GLRDADVEGALLGRQAGSPVEDVAVDVGQSLAQHGSHVDLDVAGAHAVGVDAGAAGGVDGDRATHVVAADDLAGVVGDRVAGVAVGAGVPEDRVVGLGRPLKPENGGVAGGGVDVFGALAGGLEDVRGVEGAWRGGHPVHRDGDVGGLRKSGRGPERNRGGEP